MLPLSQISFLGHGLNRPECVITHESGLLFAADWTGDGGVAILTPQGEVTRHLSRGAPRALRPNGIALELDGRFLLAELGEKTGGIWRLHPNGAVEPILAEIDGAPLPPTNYAHRDAAGRLWVTVSTRSTPRHLAWRADVADGFIVLVAHGRPRIVADGLGYTNECITSPDGDYLYVNETFARRLTRFRITDDGLAERETVAVFGEGTFPDGLVFDAKGGIWVTSIVSNRVIRVTPDGEQEIVIEDADPAHIAWVEQSYRAGELERAHLDTVKSARLKSISSLAFGGPDRRTAYLGCLLGDAVACFPSPVAGAVPAHWSYSLDELGEQLAATQTPSAVHKETSS